MLTEAQKARLAALKAKSDLSDDEKSELAELETLAAGDGDAGNKYDEAYVKSLRQESAKYRTKLREMEDKLSKLSDIDPEAYKKFMEEKETREREELEKAGEFEKLRLKMADEHKKELEKEQQKLSTYEQQVSQLQLDLDKTLIGNEIANAAAIAKALNPKLIEMAAASNLKVEVLENGHRTVRVLDTDGSPRVDLKTGKPLSVMQFVEEMRQSEEYAMLFSGGRSGSGSNTSTSFNGRNIQNPWKKDTFNLTLQGQIVKADSSLANRLKAEAGVA